MNSDPASTLLSLEFTNIQGIACFERHDCFHCCYSEQ